jgi:hypothetical protein
MQRGCGQQLPQHDRGGQCAARPVQRHGMAPLTGVACCVLCRFMCAATGPTARAAMEAAMTGERLAQPALADLMCALPYAARTCL